MRLLSLAIAVIILAPGLAEAHIGNLPPFMKVNGQYSTQYPVVATSLTDFALPQDSSPDNYLLNEVINFEIDTTRLSLPQVSNDAVRLTWDFGDGATATGLMNAHVYTKQGSYLLTITAHYGEPDQTMVIQSMLVHIVPSRQYRPPAPAITINSWPPAQSVTDRRTAAFSKDVVFDASASVSASSEIIDYFWDFGDGESATGQKVAHHYSPYMSAQALPILRVKDANGFYADLSIQLDDSERTGSAQTAQKPHLPYGLIAGMVIAAAGLSFLVFRRGKRTT